MNEKEGHHQELNSAETVLILQGGGSLGAYECGVYKALAKHNIKFDIIAGTSIGGVNASLIASNQDNTADEAAYIMERFWLSLAETIVPPIASSALPNKIRASLSSMYATVYGNPKAFMPRWFMPGTPDYFSPYNWTYLYDNTPLKNTLKRYVNFTKLRRRRNHNNNNNNDDDNRTIRQNQKKDESDNIFTKNNNNNDSTIYSDTRPPRLILTSTDIQKGEPVIFDSNNMDIDVDHVIACTGYPFYGIPWTKKDGRYLWDGSLLSNTPVLEVINASPTSDKKFYIVDVFSRRQDQLPKNMSDVWHRARDIMYIDKTDNNVKILNLVTKHHVNLLKELYQIISSAKLDEKNKARLEKIRPDCDELVHNQGAIISEVIRIQRKETEHFIFEDADFSLRTIKRLIKQGEEDAENIFAKGKGTRL